MSVQLLRPYAGYATGAVVALDSDTEAALIAQSIAVASAGGVTAQARVGAPDMYASQGGGYPIDLPQSGIATPSPLAGPPRLACIPMGVAALTGFETNGVAQTAGTFNLCEIWVPYVNTWTGVNVLQGTTVGTNKLIGALYSSAGTLLANSAVAGVITAGASTFLLLPFTSTLLLIPGRYIIGIQADGNTDTIRHLLVANGATNSTGTVAGTFGTVPATITAPSTFTTAVGPICGLYT